MHFLEPTKRQQDSYLIRNVIFEACMNGSFGWNCESPCITGYYGSLCKTPCECLHHLCDKETGCQSEQNESCKFYTNQIWTSVFLFPYVNMMSDKKIVSNIIRLNFKMFEFFSNHQLHPDYFVYNKHWRNCKSGTVHW